MHDVAEINTSQPGDWTPTPEQVRHARRNDAYPPAGRVATPGRPVGSGPQLR
ncbi:hypothetical protein [Actinoplanes subglobosus]|uniref:Uncharacterized protein n=1 Tax=Actinoplanes subglobosus TaxID=1547892 RepID=A0ABV8J5G8_9ACTN